jgi:hypothetical protein
MRHSSVMTPDRTGRFGTVAGVGRFRQFVGSLGLVAACLAAGCNDDDAGAGEAVTQEQYDTEAVRLCAQHGDVLARAYAETRPDSDAEEAAFYESDLIPRGRSLIHRLAEMGFPPENDAAYREAFNEALAVLDQIDAEPYRYIDQRHRRELAPEEDLINRLKAAFVAADVPC